MACPPGWVGPKGSLQPLACSPLLAHVSRHLWASWRNMGMWPCFVKALTSSL